MANVTPLSKKMTSPLLQYAGITLAIVENPYLHGDVSVAHGE